MSTLTLAPPERSYQQRMQALRSANEIRIARAQIRRDIAAGRASVGDVLEAPPDEAEGASIEYLLLAQHGWGPKRVDRFLALNRISPRRTVRGLTPRQRTAVARALSRSPRRRRSLESER